jgi:hypothetical protein
VRASVYDRNDAKEEETKKVLIDPTLEGKTREEMGLEPFKCTEIRSSVMGIPVFISGTWKLQRLDKQQEEMQQEATKVG